MHGAETLFICFKEYFRPKRPSSTWKAVTMSSNLEGSNRLIIASSVSSGIGIRVIFGAIQSRQQMKKALPLLQCLLTVLIYME